MAELADAHGSGPCESNFMQVQVLLPAPKKTVFGLSFFFAKISQNARKWLVYWAFGTCVDQVEFS